MSMPQLRRSLKRNGRPDCRGGQTIEQSPGMAAPDRSCEGAESEWGFVNMAVKPDYRVYMTDVNMGLENFSNQFSEGTAYLKVTGKFMGSGLTQVSATFRWRPILPISIFRSGW